MIDIEFLRAALERVTPGEWTTKIRDPRRYVWAENDGKPRRIVSNERYFPTETKANVDLIALSKNNMEGMLQLVGAVQTAINQEGSIDPSGTQDIRGALAALQSHGEMPALTVALETSTQGEWTVAEDYSCIIGFYAGDTFPVAHPVVAGRNLSPSEKNNLSFIVAAQNALPAMLHFVNAVTAMLSCENEIQFEQTSPVLEAMRTLGVVSPCLEHQPSSMKMC